MVNPLEIRVALNATTNQGLAAHQELAGQQYRQLQELKHSHQESLVRPSIVTETKEDQAAEFKRIQNPGEDNPRKQELFERNRKRQKKREAFRPYAPNDKTQKTTPLIEAGQSIDLRA